MQFLIFFSDKLVILMTTQKLIKGRNYYLPKLHKNITLQVSDNGQVNQKFQESLSDSNEIRTHNHIVLKRTLNHLAKLA